MTCSLDLTGKGTTDAIFTVRQMQKYFRVKGKKLYFGFVDLEKAFDNVPKEVIRWAMCKFAVEELLVSAVMSMYTGAKTVVSTICGHSSGFEVKVGMHQDSALSPPWKLLYADYLVVIAEAEEDLIKRLNEWKDDVENRGTKVVVGGECRGLLQGAARWPCCVCCRGVGGSSIQCTSCQK